VAPILTHPRPPAAPAPAPGPRRIACIFGTRPEAIKMAPVVRALAATPGLAAEVIVTGQHREMLDQALGLFGLRPVADLAVMDRAKGPAEVTAAILAGLGPVLARHAPDAVLVHGDTATTLAASLAAFYARIPVGHVEAGLRTHDLAAPFPEEMVRRLVAQIADVHFAPTDGAARNLLAEGVDPARIAVTGNTAIDALTWVRDEMLAPPGARAAIARRFAWRDPARHLVLVTGHRRENQAGGLGRIAAAVARLAARGDLQVLWPVHPSPAVRDQVRAALGRQADVHLTAPLDYLAFAWAMDTAALIVTDSGGIQEEAPALGTPVLVTRETTERTEAVAAGTVRLVGTDPDRIVAEAARLLDDPAARAAMVGRKSPYGDGRAAARIAARIARETPARAGLAA